MRRLSSFISPFAALLFCAAAHATPIAAGTYTLTNTSVQGYTLTGTITLNSSGLATAANITFNDAAVGTPVFSTIQSANSGGNPTADFAYIAGSSGQVALYYMTSLDNSGNIDLCIYNVSCQSYQGSYTEIYFPSGFNGNGSAYLTSGTLDPKTGVTPEPSSLALLGTGFLAGAEGLRRRLLRA